MPEMTVTVRWPDGTQDDCYSPSLVMHDHLTEGTTYTVAEFADRAVAALSEASARVQAKFGFACTSAAATAAKITDAAERYRADDPVHVVAMHPDLGDA
ncbi:MSMEG_0570 family nitrogen starvation response protein [Solicola sp. PLA-1-18]|uniref:MSMEG_0570 family nitrogen starvation response protein n=1 Tax=Solicola sp. PLA-1-18 TaxID=3380532 RepID=UPI003B7EA5EF